MSNAVEIIKAVVSPVTKLIDAVSGAIGKLYEPVHIRRTADARAYEIQAEAKALRENADIPIQYRAGEITASTEVDLFVQRAQSRLAYQELLKQQNIEQVTDKAYEILSHETVCSDEPVDRDWMIRFFNSVEDISNEAMQEIWAKILAGEVKEPKSFSLRTLETLKNLSQDEASLFEYVCQAVVCSDGDYFIPNDSFIFKTLNIEYADILRLDECGLISAIGTVNRYFDIAPNGKSYAIFGNKSIEIFARNCGKQLERAVIEVYPMTKIGEQIISLFEHGLSDEALLQYAREFKGENQKLKVTAYYRGDEAHENDLL